MTGKDLTMHARTLVAVLVLALAALAGDARAADPPSAASLLESADRARGGLARGITWTVTLTSEEDGDRSERSFLVRARGDDGHGCRSAGCASDAHRGGHCTGGNRGRAGRARHICSGPSSAGSR